MKRKIVIIWLQSYEISVRVYTVSLIRFDLSVVRVTWVHLRSLYYIPAGKGEGKDLTRI